MVQDITSNKYIQFVNNFLKYSNYLCLFVAYVIILVGIIEGVIYLIHNAINKFYSRFLKVEAIVNKEDMNMKKMSLKEIDALWEKIKK